MMIADLVRTSARGVCGGGKFNPHTHANVILRIEKGRELC
jgi:hypothetical protein